MRRAGKFAVIMLVIAVLLPLNLPVSGGYSGPEPEPSLTMLAVGDLMLGREVEKLAAASSQGLDYPFAPTSDLTHAADLTFGNLESPLVLPEAAQAIDPSEGYLLQASPAYAAHLKQAGFNLLSLANNHAFDYGPAGVASTVKSLREAGLPFAGAGENPVATLFFEKNGLKLALVAATQADPREPDRAGAYVALFDSERVLQQIREARSQADLVIVALHWGSEYQAAPSKWQQEWVVQASAAGADLILGAHPHVVGPFEVLNNRTVVAYSLGNFIFDSRNPPATTQSAGLYLKLDKKGVAAAMVVPLKIEGDRPRPLQPEEREAGLNQLNQTPGKNPAFQAQALYWNGADWAVSPGLFYRRDATPDGTINLAASRTLQVRDLASDLGGYSTGRVIDASAPDSEQTTEERLELKDGRLSVWRPGNSGWQLIYKSPPEWRVQQFAFGDADEDGRNEVVFSLWKNNGQDDKGLDRSHPFVYGWRRGAFRPVWAGSALADPIREFALADFKGDGHNQLVVLEGNYADPQNAAAHFATVWGWNGWGYELLFRSPQGHYSSLDYLPGQPYAFFKQTS